LKGVMEAGPAGEKRGKGGWKQKKGKNQKKAWWGEKGKSPATIVEEWNLGGKVTEKTTFWGKWVGGFLEERGGAFDEVRRNCNLPRGCLWAKGGPEGMVEKSRAKCSGFFVGTHERYTKGVDGKKFCRAPKGAPGGTKGKELLQGKRRVLKRRRGGPRGRQQKGLISLGWDGDDKGLFKKRGREVTRDEGKKRACSRVDGATRGRKSWGGS